MKSKVAIVGTTHLTENQEKEMRNHIFKILKLCFKPDETIIISGGAAGVDTISIDVAINLGFETIVIPPQIKHWEDIDGKTGFMTRNLEIASMCDELYCFTVPLHNTKCYHHDTPQEHEKTAGCWTALKAADMGKSCVLEILPVSSI